MSIYVCMYVCVYMYIYTYISTEIGHNPPYPGSARRHDHDQPRRARERGVAVGRGHANKQETIII